ncbi:MAG: hypothetical protein BWX80_03482 [Candidatus Hydrogenedentes bacterium ADurb.Bin101]|nr:MAG: hypothetical protein BWX80_03482 [Candidatus Hydrogenedentes bacterium ADurb.Bin101]
MAARIGRLGINGACHQLYKGVQQCFLHLQQAPAFQGYDGKTGKGLNEGDTCRLYGRLLATGRGVKGQSQGSADLSVTGPKRNRHKGFLFRIHQRCQRCFGIASQYRCGHRFTVPHRPGQRPRRFNTVQFNIRQVQRVFLEGPGRRACTSRLQGLPVFIQQVEHGAIGTTHMHGLFGNLLQQRVKPGFGGHGGNEIKEFLDGRFHGVCGFSKHADFQYQGIGCHGARKIKMADAVRLPGQFPQGTGNPAGQQPRQRQCSHQYQRGYPYRLHPDRRSLGHQFLLGSRNGHKKRDVLRHNNAPDRPPPCSIVKGKGKGGFLGRNPIGKRRQHGAAQFADRRQFRVGPFRLQNQPVRITIGDGTPVFIEQHRLCRGGYPVSRQGFGKMFQRDIRSNHRMAVPRLSAHGNTHLTDKEIQIGLGRDFTVRI